VDAFVGAVEQALKKKDEVRLVGFGTFYVSKRAATKGRNPRTGAEISIPASWQQRFKPGKSLKDAIS
ncbi:MAG: HU family DNA-binding protein, partial [Holosporales bacterium]|nr:HU family DNA-binding protein [Holosporales bacterium]